MDTRDKAIQLIRESYCAIRNTQLILEQTEHTKEARNLSDGLYHIYTALNGLEGGLE